MKSLEIFRLFISENIENNKLINNITKDYILLFFVYYSGYFFFLKDIYHLLNKKIIDIFNVSFFYNEINNIKKIFETLDLTTHEDLNLWTPEYKKMVKIKNKEKKEKNNMLLNQYKNGILDTYNEIHKIHNILYLSIPKNIKNIKKIKYIHNIEKITNKKNKKSKIKS